MTDEQPSARRGPKPRYSLEQIADAGMAIADAEGLAAVTMQRIAAQLGTTKMALYRYVPGRTELDAVMLDRSLGEAPTRSGADWRTALTAWATALYERSLARPWSVELAQRPHAPGPTELSWFEAGLAAMTGLPLRGGQKLDVLVLLSGHAMALVRQQVGGPTPERDLAAAVTATLAGRADDFPLTAAAFADSDEDEDDALLFGIERIIAGVEALAATRA